MPFCLCVFFAKFTIVDYSNLHWICLFYFSQTHLYVSSITILIVKKKKEILPVAKQFFFSVASFYCFSHIVTCPIWTTLNNDVSVYRWRISCLFFLVFLAALEGPFQALDNYSITAVVNDTVEEQSCIRLCLYFSCNMSDVWKNNHSFI